LIDAVILFGVFSISEVYFLYISLQGKRYQSHVGNIALKNVVDDLLPRYESLGKQEKTELADEVVKTVKARKGRFLSQENGVWMETHDDVSRAKVAQLFRNRRKLVEKVSSIGSDAETTVGGLRTNMEVDNARIENEPKRSRVNS
jgi:hypothetical protein